jgi:ADP-heptose:LPS heptosyltransferase
MPYHYSLSVKVKTVALEGLAWLLLWPWMRKDGPGQLEGSGRSVLLVEPFQMGDILSLTPLIDPLLTRFPGCKLFFLTKPSSAALLRLDTRVTGVLEFDFIWSDYGLKRKVNMGYLLRLIRFMWSLRRCHFDLGIDTRGDVRSQILLSLAGCHTRIGYHRYLASNVCVKGWLLNRSLAGSATPIHRYDWNLNLLALAGCASGLPARFPSFKPSLTGAAVPSGPYVLIHVGGGWEFKRWGEEKWASLIGRLISSGRKAVVIGAAQEKEILEGIRGMLGSSIEEGLTFRTTSLQELIALVSACELFVGLDSGPMNLAVCLGKPVVALFGPGDSTMWYPYHSRESLVHHAEKFPCNPCDQSFCRFPKHSCMNDIDVEEVFRKINSRYSPSL